LLAVSIGLGLGSIEIIADLLRTFYSRKNYEVGDRVKIKGIEGTVEAIDNICMTLRTSEGKMVIPIKKVMDNTVEIKL
jgi:small-conductance mechanosensitive channel